MTSIILQLQQESLDRSVSVTDLLRKSLVVSRKLRLGEFEAWINSELIGYGSQDEVPLYRKVKGSVKFWKVFQVEGRSISLLLGKCKIEFKKC